jgi:hypothetical protein
MTWIRQHLPLRAILSLLGLAVLVAVLFLTTGRISDSTEDQSYETLAQTLRRAAIHCYAVEGRYPPDLDYLTSEYDITIDEAHYTVYYTYIGSNLMPDITVLPIGTEEVPW